MKPLRYLLRTSFRACTSTVTVTLCTIIVAMFGLNIIFGYCETRYKNVAPSVEYTAISIADMDERAKKADMLAELEPYGATAALYICRTKDGAVLIGFDGSDVPDLYWAHLAGSFINDKNEEGFPNIIYLNTEGTEQVTLGSLYELDGKTYRTVGRGWIIPAVFAAFISPSSPQTVFKRQSGISNVDVNDTSRVVRVIPYKAFCESYEPELVMIHFPQLYRSGVLKMSDKLKSMYPGSTVTPPDKDAYEEFWFALKGMGRFIPLFMLLTEITVVLAVCELVKKLRSEILVLRIYGLSKRSLLLYLLMEVALLYLLGTGLALLLQAALLSPLSVLLVEEMPSIVEVAVAVLASLTVSLLFSMPEMLRSIRVTRSGEE